MLTLAVIKDGKYRNTMLCFVLRLCLFLYFLNSVREENSKIEAISASYLFAATIVAVSASLSYANSCPCLFSPTFYSIPFNLFLFVFFFFRISTPLLLLLCTYSLLSI